MLLVDSRNTWESQKKKELLTVLFSQTLIINKKNRKDPKRCLRIILKDYESDYKNLLGNSNKPTMEIRRLRTLAV